MPNRVLIIDDETRLAEVLKIRLDALGFEVVTVFSGEEGVRTARDWQPDVIILDIRMPGLDGYQVCRIAKTDPSLCEIPIIVVSASVHQPARQAILKAGAREFITKPYQTSHLIAAINGAIESRNRVGEMKQ